MEERNLRKIRTGVVTGNKMDKTITVAVERKVKHPIYGSSLRKQRDSMHTTKKTSAQWVIPYVSWKHVL